MPTDPPTGWYSRGYQPHLNTPRLLQFVTFHLADSLPRPTLLRLMAETEDNDAERHRRLERMLEAGNFAWWLNRPEIGRLVEGALLADDGASYQAPSLGSDAESLLNNHFHLREGVFGAPLADLDHIKGDGAPLPQQPVKLFR